MDLFPSLAIVVGLAAIGGTAAKLLKQPAIVGYIVAGIAISLLGITNISSSLGQLGVTLLLFLVGLELPLEELRRRGGTVVISCLGQMSISGLLAYLAARFLGFSDIVGVYLGIGMAFSSTVLIVNLLAAKKDLQSLYGRLAIGITLLQDFVAIGILVVLSGLAHGSVSLVSLSLVLVKGLILIGAAVWASDRILPKVLDWFGRYPEILFIASLGWCLAIAAIVSSPLIGFSVELGGFLAGLMLANAAQNLQIVSRIRPLRDFFMTLFFVGLGASIGLTNITQLFVPVVVLSGLVLIGNPIIHMLILGVLGYKKRVAFQTGTTVSQVSEFSLIMMAMANKAGLVPASVVSLVAIVALLTMFVSSYVVLHNDKIYRKIGKWLPFIARKAAQDQTVNQNKIVGEVVLFGHNRVGKILRPVLEKLTTSLVVVDFDPQILAELAKNQIPAVYGDIADYELYDELALNDALMVISTVSDVNDNLQLLVYLKTLKKQRPIFIALATDDHDARKLYKAGADYVLVPHSTGGDLLAHILGTHGLDKKYIDIIGELHFKRICAAT